MKEKLLKEFEDLYKTPPTEISKDTDGIIVLSGAVHPKEENISRIEYGLNVLNTLGHPVPLIFSGVSEEREEKLALMEQLDVPKSLIRFQDCGKLGITNTKTQFETLVADPLTKDLKNLIIVTSTYHIPRVKRTAGKLLPMKTRFVVVGNHEDWKIHNSFLMIMDEVRRIIEYSAKGDILINPR
jgi:uncharacterized SAM-binding protein YcdF (DUF218 family)